MTEHNHIRGRVLIVEDRDITRKILKDFLINQGLEIVEAKDGQECIRLALNQKPDLILLDLSIPVINGWETARLIKSNRATKEIPVIAVTAHTLVEDREEAIAAGCDDYLAKPLNHQILLDKIKNYLHT